MLPHVVFAAIVVGSVFAPRPRPRPTMSSAGNEKWTRTVIAVEFDRDDSDYVFILGGFTNGSLSRCNGPANLDPCSIPIQHLFSSADDLGKYKDWANKDEFLDFHGAESRQGYSEGVRAAGTPTRKLDGSTGLGRLIFRMTASQNKTFWAVELNMDCTGSNNFFEVQVVLKTSNSKRRFATADLYGPGLAWSSDRANPPSRRSMPGSRSPVHPMRWLQDSVKLRQKRADPTPGFSDRTSLGGPFGQKPRHDIRLADPLDVRTPRTQLRMKPSFAQGQLNLAGRNPGFSPDKTSLGRPFEQKPRHDDRLDPLVVRTRRTQLRMKPSFAEGISHGPIALRGPQGPSCMEDFPYTTSRFVGKRGQVNIFKYSNGDCVMKPL